MSLIVADRVQETCSAPGTGAVTLLGAVTGYQTFSAAVGNGNTCYYTIADQSGANWEVGIGAYATSGNTLTRTTPLSGSSATPVNFSSGTQNVFVTYPAEVAVYASNNSSGAANQVLTSQGPGNPSIWTNAGQLTYIGGGIIGSGLDITSANPYSTYVLYVNDLNSGGVSYAALTIQIGYGSPTTWVSSYNNQSLRAVTTTVSSAFTSANSTAEIFRAVTGSSYNAGVVTTITGAAGFGATRYAHILSSYGSQSALIGMASSSASLGPYDNVYAVRVNATGTPTFSNSYAHLYGVAVA